MNDAVAMVLVTLIVVALSLAGLAPDEKAFRAVLGGDGDDFGRRRVALSR